MAPLLLSLLLAFNTNTDSLTTYQLRFWEKVYDNKRLHIINHNISVSGVIYEVKKSFDGDMHLTLKLDSASAQKVFLVNKNYTKQDSCLVVEIICGHSTIFPICYMFDNPILVPKKGDKVMVTGAFVYDKRHNWTEIHPVYNLEILPIK
jgi:hypothetical protein